MDFRLKLTALAVFLCAAPAASASCTNNQDGIYSCSHVELVASMTRTQLGADDSGGTDISNDIWGWTDPSDGKEYVIVGMYNGTAFVDISDPVHPVFLGRLLSPPATPFLKTSPPSVEKCHDDCGASASPEFTETSSWQDIKVYDHYAYIVSEQDWFGMLVFDLHKLRGVGSPEAFTASSHIRDFRNAHNIFINEDTGFAYVVGNTKKVNGDPNFGGLLIYDLSDPAHPALMTDYEEIGYVHDISCVAYDGPDTDYDGREICFASNSGKKKEMDASSPYFGQSYYYDDNTNDYYSDWTYDGTYLNWDHGGQTLWPTPGLPYSRLTVLDVTDKDKIAMLSQAEHPNSSYVHQSWPSADLHYLFVNDEVDEKTYGNNTRSYTYNVSDLDNIGHVSTYTAPNLAIDHNEYVKGRLLFQSNYDSGLRILDAGDPRHLSEVAFFDSQPSLDSAHFEGSWSNYPYFESGIIAFSDIRDGLFLVRPKLEQGDALGSDVAVDARLLETGADAVYYLAVANNGPATAKEIDITAHLPDGASFSAVTNDGGGDCGAAGRVVRCQLATLPSCETALIELTVSPGAPQEAEITGMAAAQQLDPTDAADNIVTLQLSSAVGDVDAGALQTDLIGPGCASVPTASAGDDRSVEAGAVAELAATATDEHAVIVSYAWQQTEGPEVSLTATDSASTTFTAPDIASETLLTFKVTATNAYGKSGSDTVSINVKPVASNAGTGDKGGGGGTSSPWLLALLGVAITLHRRSGKRMHKP